MGQAAVGVIRQHLIDPEICIRCNTCESICPVGAITHDANNYVVDAAKCNRCMDCISPCPTGSIDNWRDVPAASAYPIDAQFGWEELPAELDPSILAQAVANGGAGATDTADSTGDATTDARAGDAPFGDGFETRNRGASTPAVADAASVTGATDVAGGGPGTASGLRAGATVPPWSAAHAFTNLYGPKGPQGSITATVTGNVRVTEVGSDYDTHHLVLDFGRTPFPVLEGQSIGVVPPGVDARGRPHHARQYSIASPRNGERPGYNNVALTLKRVLEDHDGRPVRGVASNYLCDAAVGDRIEVVGPFGASFLMPNHPGSHIVMICTGTGSAPMRAMTEWRRRLRKSGRFEGGRLMLFFGARTREELPYFGPLQKLPTDFIDIEFAFSRTPGAPKRYVQDAMRARANDLAPLLADPDCYFYVCGLKAMEEGVLQALEDIATGAGLGWAEVAHALKRDGRLHLETY
ncbi:MAG: benzoyl-CoA 2,3-epoxidase subunit BoxA [Lautropia sp.]